MLRNGATNFVWKIWEYIYNVLHGALDIQLYNVNTYISSMEQVSSNKLQICCA